MRIISITGKAGSGKDTIAKIVTDELTAIGLNVTKLSYAGPLKDCATLLWGWDRDRLEYDFDYKEGNTLDDGSPDLACEALGMTRRVFMQRFGTEAMRQNIHQDVWIIALKLAIKRGDYDQYDIGIIPDARFINELKFVSDLGGRTIKVERSGAVKTLTDSTQHASELEWEQWNSWDAVVQNYISENKSIKENLELLKQIVITNVLNPLIPQYHGYDYVKNTS